MYFFHGHVYCFTPYGGAGLKNMGCKMQSPYMWRSWIVSLGSFINFRSWPMLPCPWASKREREREASVLLDKKKRLSFLTQNKPSISFHF